MSNLPQEKFVNSVFQFFIGVGAALLEGNESGLVSLEKFNKERSIKYTVSIVKNNIWK